MPARPQRVTGAINFACGHRIRYDDEDDRHRALRLSKTLPRPLLPCPTHGMERALCAVTGPSQMLWPDPAERAEVLAERGRDRFVDMDVPAL